MSTPEKLLEHAERVRDVVNVCESDSKIRKLNKRIGAGDGKLRQLRDSQITKAVADLERARGEVARDAA